jgi:hypothetical protein
MRARGDRQVLLGTGRRADILHRAMESVADSVAQSRGLLPPRVDVQLQDGWRDA